MKITFWQQPIYATATHQIVGVEWLTRREGEETAAELWRWAAEHHAIATLERWILDHLVQWRFAPADTDSSLVWFINLHPQGVVREVLQDIVEWKDRQHRLAPVVWELLESDGWTPDVITRLTQAHSVLALDDWGNHRDTTNRLVTWPVQWVKLDARLVQQLPHPAMRQWVETLHTYHMHQHKYLVAEGVETPEQWQIVQQLGIPYCQGFALAMPQPFRTVEWPDPSANVLMVD